MKKQSRRLLPILLCIAGYGLIPQQVFAQDKEPVIDSCTDAINEWDRATDSLDLVHAVIAQYQQTLALVKKEGDAQSVKNLERIIAELELTLPKKEQRVNAALDLIDEHCPDEDE
ncbi:MAG: hypothetical protein KDD44_05640 [Bdellovibrionales bacterium]|nr:hypothetical protein [Bdellovibrionales bacterium]